MEEKDGCGVGFLVSLKGERTNNTLKEALNALNCMEHRGGVGPEEIGDGAGIMTGIPFELFNREPNTFAVASLLLPQDKGKKELSLKVFEETFWQFNLKVSGYREVPIDPSVISPLSLKIMPSLLQAIVERPDHCRTLYSFERLLYLARQRTRTKEPEPRKKNMVYTRSSFLIPFLQERSSIKHFVKVLILESFTWTFRTIFIRQTLLFFTGGSVPIPYQAGTKCSHFV